MIKRIEKKDFYDPQHKVIQKKQNRGKRYQRGIVYFLIHFLIVVSPSF